MGLILSSETRPFGCLSGHLGRLWGQGVSIVADSMFPGVSPAVGLGGVVQCLGLARFLPSLGGESGCALLRVGAWVSGSARFIEWRERVGWQAIRLQRRSP